jgi:hypothetical protein
MKTANYYMILSVVDVQILEGSLPHNQNVSASETGLVEVATSGPQVVGSGNPSTAKSRRDDIYAMA